MGVVSKLVGMPALFKRLDKMAARYKAEGDTGVTVGYTAAYAVIQHENTELNHPNGGQAKYLEEPARSLKKEFGDIVRQAVAKGYTILQALLLVGLRLQRESQKLVPVDTGALKNSAFTKQE